jgi:hypothetical protein
MTGMAHHTRPDAREPLVLGIILVAVGVGGLVVSIAPASGGWVLLTIGLTLITLFAFTRAYGALIPGGILSGLALGILATELGPWTVDGGLIVAGLGVGFISIWVIGLLAHVEEQHPWPLIPGTILLTVGTLLSMGDATTQILSYWPLVVIAIGLVVLGRGLLGDAPD